ncbi:MAG: VWA domain-containing protein [Terriglobia bacterium]|jgi:VWFA-related protein
MRSRYSRRAILLLVGLLLFASSASDWYAQSNGEQQPSTGPSPEVGPTVLAPKKTQPPPPETEKKPERINPNEIFTLSTTTNLVNVDVMVLDKDGNPLSNLSRKNFRLSDDGVPQTVSNFGTAQAPMTTCMVIEFSNRYWAFLYLALRYAYNYLQFIQPKDWTAVVSFDMKPQILTDFTQDRSEVRGALDTLRIPGFSEICVYDALSFTLDRMKDIKGRKAILLVCTGFDTFSKLTYDEILKIVKSSDTMIYPVSILEFMTVRSPRGEGIGALQARNALETMAKYSGGQAYFPRFEGELPGIFEQISGQLRLQYGLGFVPTNPAKDGKFHKLKVDLVDEQGNPLRIVSPKGKVVKYRVVAREGYYAPKS